MFGGGGPIWYLFVTKPKTLRNLVKILVLHHWFFGMAVFAFMMYNKIRNHVETAVEPPKTANPHLNFGCFLIYIVFLEHHLETSADYPVKILERSIYSARYCFVENLKEIFKSYVLLKCLDVLFFLLCYLWMLSS